MIAEAFTCFSHLSDFLKYFTISYFQPHAVGQPVIARGVVCVLSREMTVREDKTKTDKRTRNLKCLIFVIIISQSKMNAVRKNRPYPPLLT